MLPYCGVAEEAVVRGLPALRLPDATVVLAAPAVFAFAVLVDAARAGAAFRVRDCAERDLAERSLAERCFFSAAGLLRERVGWTW
jgi:hypothetical protein